MFHFGVDYYPEQWPEERWPRDAELMVRAGFTCVRLAEFSWGVLERAEGALEFGWLDRAVGLLAERGLKVVLGTPTASPPSWLMRKELARVQEDGSAVPYGNRRGYCPSNTVYREHCRRIVTAMADRLGAHPAVIGWQIDNEFGDRCFCESCRRSFHRWLADRHGSLEEMNRRWGTAFWGHTYRCWEDVPLPLAAAAAPNPGLALDYRRFVSDLYAGFQREQIQIVRPRSPGRFLTHNFMGFASDTLDQHRLAGDLDFGSWDNYPRTQWSMTEAVDPASAALSHAATRGLSSTPFWVIEQQAGPAGWEMIGVPPRPGELALWAWQSVAHGADGVVFFRWRTARFGTEVNWHGLLDHDGAETRRYAEIAQMGVALRRVGPAVAGTRVSAQAALMVSPDSRFSLQAQPTNPGLGYTLHAAGLHRAFHRAHIALDIVYPGSDLAPYRLLVAPLLTVVHPEEAEALAAFVRRGGLLVLTFRAGSRDGHNAAVDARLPGALRELCGIEVPEYDSLPPGATRRLLFLPRGLRAASGPHDCSWCDVLEMKGAEPLALYADGHYRGRPAVSLHRLGTGRVVYVGVAAGQPLYDALVPWLAEAAGVERVIDAPPDVEATIREGDGKRMLFLLNHGTEPRRVALGPWNGTELISGAAVGGRLTLGPREVRILAVDERP